MPWDSFIWMRVLQEKNKHDAAVYGTWGIKIYVVLKKEWRVGTNGMILRLKLVNWETSSRGVYSLCSLWLVYGDYFFKLYPYLMGSPYPRALNCFERKLFTRSYIPVLLMSCALWLYNIWISLKTLSNEEHCSRILCVVWVSLWQFDVANWKITMFYSKSS